MAICQRPHDVIVLSRLHHRNYVLLIRIIINEHSGVKNTPCNGHCINQHYTLDNDHDDTINIVNLYHSVHHCNYGVPRMQKFKLPPPHPPLVGAQGYQRFPLCKPVVYQNIALDAVLA